MTDKIKEIAESHTEDLKFKLLLLTPTDSQHEIIYDEMIKAITEYESSEIARLRGIIEMDVKAIRDPAEQHPLFMGYGLTMEEINAEGGDASFVTDIAYKAQSILSEAEEQ